MNKRGGLRGETYASLVCCTCVTIVMTLTALHYRDLYMMNKQVVLLCNTMMESYFSPK